VGEVCSSLCRLVGCQQITTVGFRPEANGIAERLNAEIKPHLQSIVNARQVQNRWSKSLPLIQHLLNATVQSTTARAGEEGVQGWGAGPELCQLENQQECPVGVSSLKLFKCPPHVDPVTVAGSMDEGEYLVHSIVAHRLEGPKRKNRTNYYFLVKFEDGEEEWIPYWEVRDREAFDLYLRNHQDLARLLKFEVP
jgi:hypothetical protein